MTGLSRTDGSTGFERLAALGRRSRPSRTSGSGGPNFDSLLADALQQQARPTPKLANGQPAAWTPPQGALGVGSLAIDALNDSKNAATTATSTSAAVGSATASTAAANRATVGETVNSGSAGEAVVNAAAKHLGVPYLWGGTDAEHGFDCSGLIQDAYRQIGVEMPKWSRHQATMGVEVASLDEALPGDVLAFGDPVNHVGLYVGDGKMLHAPKTGDVVRVGPIEREIVTIRRIVEPTAGQATGAATMAELLASAENGAVPSVANTSQTQSATASSHSPGEAERRYQPLFESAGERWDVDPALLAAVAKTESAFNPNAVSHVGAQGLMQFMPATAREMGVNPLDPASAIDGAARYLRTSLDQFENTEHAIASYNAGRGAVSRYGGIPPYTETQNYVVKVLEAWRSRS